jgi:hypothetical protein
MTFGQLAQAVSALAVPQAFAYHEVDFGAYTF